MREFTSILMNSHPGWVDEQTMDANSVYHFKDAVMVIDPNGNWRCTGPRTKVTLGVATGNFQNLEEFLNAWDAANP